MNIAIGLVIIIIIASLVGTLMLAGKSDKNYRTATKSNTYRLTTIYVIVILLSLIALVWYIKVI